MSSIRRKLVDGDNYDDIIAYLGGMVSERTFYRYLKQIWAEIIDIEIKMYQSAATIITMSLFTDCTYSKISSKFFTS